MNKSFVSYTIDGEGILYIATGKKFLEEAAENAKAGRNQIGSRKIAIVTDNIAEAEKTGCFDICIIHPDPRFSYRDKIPPLINLPFEKTLFLDSDARIISSVDGLFHQFEWYDFGAAHAPVRIPDGWGDKQIPNIFPEFNSGVLLLRRSELQESLIRKWLEKYDIINQAWDQATLRSAVWEMLNNGLRHQVLPPEANFRTTKPWIAGQGLEVVIVHGRVPQDEWLDFSHYLNQDINKFRTGEEWFKKFPWTKIKYKIADPTENKSLRSKFINLITRKNLRSK